MYSQTMQIFEKSINLMLFIISNEEKSWLKHYNDISNVWLKRLVLIVCDNLTKMSTKRLHL